MITMITMISRLMPQVNSVSLIKNSSIYEVFTFVDSLLSYCFYYCIDLSCRLLSCFKVCLYELNKHTELKYSYTGCSHVTTYRMKEGQRAPGDL